jgi:hypothetical protein
VVSRSAANQEFVGVGYGNSFRRSHKLFPTRYRTQPDKLPIVSVAFGLGIRTHGG